MTFTFNLEDALIGTGFASVAIGVIMLIYFFVRLGRVGEVPLWLKVCGWTGFVTVVMGGLLTCYGIDARSDRIFAEKLATLPTEWQEFRANLDELEPFSLAQEALERFVKSNPPSITPKQYDILVKGSIFSGPNARDRLFDSRYIRNCVAMPFVGMPE